MVDPQAPSSISQGARCALHFGQPFTAVCQRCGTYMCQVCTEGGKFSVCPACRARTGVGSFPFRRAGFRWGDLLGFALEIYKKNWLLLTLAVGLTLFGTMVFQGVSFALQSLLVDQMGLMLALQALLILPQMLVQGLLTLGLMSIALKLVRGEPATLGMMFGEWRRLGAFLVQVSLILAINLPLFALILAPAAFALVSLPEVSAVAIAAVALSVPIAMFGFVYVGLGVAFAAVELLAQPDVGAVDALRNAWSIARTQRLAIFLCALIGGGAILLGLLACGVGVLVGYGFASLLFATLYLTLRNGAEGLVS